MWYTASEKLDITRIVERSHLPAKRTLDQLGIARRTVYRWYDRYLEGGPEARADRPSAPTRVWGRIGEDIQNQIVEMALEATDLSPRELAVRFAVEKHYFVSEAAVYRLLKAHDLTTSPALYGDQGGRSVPYRDHATERDVVETSRRAVKHEAQRVKLRVRSCHQCRPFKCLGMTPKQPFVKCTAAGTLGSKRTFVASGTNVLIGPEVIMSGIGPKRTLNHPPTDFRFAPPNRSFAALKVAPALNNPRLKAAIRSHFKGSSFGEQTGFDVRLHRACVWDCNWTAISHRDGAKCR